MDTPLLARPDPALLALFAAIVGSANVIGDEAAARPFLVENRGLYVGRTPLILCPSSTAEVAAILRLANETRTAIVPQGGNTGLVGAQIPDESGSQILLSLSRMNRIRALDPTTNTMTLEAGVTLAAAEAAASAADRLCGMWLASGETAEIGGALSTNAGGTGVLAYGMARDIALGLEVVLPSGEVWDSLRTLRKDNTGYDLKQLFIGAEGTLGVITAAVLKLFPKPRGKAVAFAAVKDPAAALALFECARALAGPSLTAAECMARIGLDFTLKHIEDARDPFPTIYPWYVLLEVSSVRSAAEADDLLSAILAAAATAGLTAATRLASNPVEAAAFWRLRLGMNDIQRREGGSIKHDVSVPLGRLPEFLTRALAIATALIPGCRPCPFGHLGDGNIHFNISQPIGMEKADFLDQWEAMNAAIHALVTELGGSISAEHGIGRLKRTLLPGVKGPVAIDLMRRIKAAFDPRGIMNPGKLL